MDTIESIVIHEGVSRCRIVFFLAVMLRGLPEEKLVVVFKVR